MCEEAIYSRQEMWKCLTAFSLKSKVWFLLGQGQPFARPKQYKPGIQTLVTPTVHLPAYPVTSTMWVSGHFYQKYDYKNKNKKTKTVFLET